MPGTSCGDPRFTGADGNTFYFHGKKDESFCLVSDSGLHINARFMGNHNQGFFYRPKFTEISEISFLSIGSDKI